MEAIGIRFAVNDAQRFEALHSIFRKLKHSKGTGEFPDPEHWTRLVPDDVKGQFSWPTSEERNHWLSVRDSTSIAIPEPSQQLGSTWDFYRVFESVEEGDYDLLSCEMTGHGVAEMQIDPHGYPYGGVGPFIALGPANQLVSEIAEFCGNIGVVGVL
jgi:hypothetical protein